MRPVAAAEDRVDRAVEVKPSNVILTTTGLPALFDFGASVAVGDAPTELTPGWAAPEIVSGAPVTPASDVHSLGALLASCVPTSRAIVELTEDMTSEDPHRRPGMAEVAARLADAAPVGAALVGAAVTTVVSGSDDSADPAAAGRVVGDCPVALTGNRFPGPLRCYSPAPDAGGGESGT